jgi:hypothetical protein
MTVLTQAPAAYPSVRLAPGSRAHKGLLALSVAGGLLFTSAYTLDGFFTSGYSTVKQPISDLAHGGHAWLQMANFMVFGLIGILSAIALRASLGAGRGRTSVPVLRALGGVAMLVVGAFPDDVVGANTTTMHGTIHTAASFVSLIATVGYLFLLASRFRAEPRWHGWAATATIAAIIMMASLGAFGAAMSMHGPAGLCERAAMIAPELLGIVFAIRLVKGTGQVATS